MRLVASMIVKDELGRYLTDAIGALLEFCDEVRVLDDGSTDGGAEWLGKQRGVSLTAASTSTFFGHEGQARQRLLDWTLQGDPTHVLAIDADEFVADGWAVRDACETGATTMTLDMQEVWEVDGDCLCVRIDGGWRPHPAAVLWAIPRRGASGLRIPDRALACGRVPTGTTGRAVETGTEILHFGWANPAEREARHQRYVVADGGRFHSGSHLDSIMWGDDKVQLSGRPWPASLFRRRSAIEQAAGR